MEKYGWRSVATFTPEGCIGKVKNIIVKVKDIVGRELTYTHIFLDGKVYELDVTIKPINLLGVTNLDPLTAQNIKHAEMKGIDVYKAKIEWREEKGFGIEGFVKPAYDYNLEYNLKDLPAVGIPNMGWIVDGYEFKYTGFETLEKERPIYMRYKKGGDCDKAINVIFRRVK